MKMTRSLIFWKAIAITTAILFITTITVYAGSTTRSGSVNGKAVTAEKDISQNSQYWDAQIWSYSSSNPR